MPFEGSGRRTHEAIAGSYLYLIADAPHGCNVSHAEDFNQICCGSWRVNGHRAMAARRRARPGQRLAAAATWSQGTQRVRMVMPPCGRPPASAAARRQKCDHMLSWISLASRSRL